MRLRKDEWSRDEEVNNIWRKRERGERKRERERDRERE